MKSSLAVDHPRDVGVAVAPLDGFHDLRGAHALLGGLKDQPAKFQAGAFLGRLGSLVGARGLPQRGRHLGLFLGSHAPIVAQVLSDATSWLGIKFPAHDTSA